MKQDDAIFVAGHRGLVGSAVVRKLEGLGFRNLLVRTRAELDLSDRGATRSFFEAQPPRHVFLCAAKVGGILANATHPADFIFENLAIQSNVIHEAWRAGARRLVFLGSSCIYPRDCPQPIKEEYLLSGPLEATNRPYAVAKIAGVEMCAAYNRQHATAFLAVMPANLYGPGDNDDLETSHVIPAMIRKFHEARAGGAAAVTLWGSGTPRREFLHVDDLADAVVLLARLERERFTALCDATTAPPLINIGGGEEVTIRELATVVQRVVGFRGEVIWDRAKPDGTPRKLLDAQRLRALGWTPAIGLEAGIRRTYADLLRRLGRGRQARRRS